MYNYSDEVHFVPHTIPLEPLKMSCMNVSVMQEEKTNIHGQIFKLDET